MKLQESTIEIATTKGKTTLPCFRIDGMLRSPIVIVAMKNNGGGVSYSITHAPSGMAIIAAFSDSLSDVVCAAKKLWKLADKQIRQWLSSSNLNTNDQEYLRFGTIVVRIRTELEEKVAKQIRQEVESERKQ